jgi:hypothetical protein
MAQVIITELSPHLSAAGSKALAPTKAPNLPAAALKPFKVDLHSLE